jgi:hypothetical protein
MDTDLMRDSTPSVPTFAQVDSTIKDEQSLTEVLSNPIDGTGDHWIRLLRAWGSVGVIGLLVAWAILKTKR